MVTNIIEIRFNHGTKAGKYISKYSLSHFSEAEGYVLREYRLQDITIT